MTAELAFAKSFLWSLDAKPVKLAADYAADPDTLELKGPVSCLLPLPRFTPLMSRHSTPCRACRTP